MKELAVCVQGDNRGVTPFETVDAICKAGFKNVFVQYYHREDIDYDELEVIDYCKKCGLNIIFCHLGYKYINDIWIEGEVGDKLTQSYMDDLDVLKERGIHQAMMHLTTRIDVPMYNPVGLARIQKIVNHAKELGMKLGLENTRYQGYLEYVLGAIQDETVGLCMDAGHIHVHFHDEFNYEFFKDRYYMIHLHDNHANYDEHLLPFDGTIDWEFVMRKLKENHYDGPITLELCYRNEYMKESIEDFYKEGYQRGLKLAEILERVDIT